MVQDDIDKRLVPPKTLLDMRVFCGVVDDKQCKTCKKWGRYTTFCYDCPEETSSPVHFYYCYECLVQHHILHGLIGNHGQENNFTEDDLIWAKEEAEYAKRTQANKQRILTPAPGD
jgi:hypothetical protein